MNMKDNRGLTLVEMVVSVTLLSVIILTTLSLLNFGQKTFTSTDNNGRVQSDAQNIVASVSKLVRESSNITVVNPGQLVLDSQAIVNRGSLLNIETLSGSLVRTLSDKVDSVYFTAASGGINIDITLATNTGSYRIKTTVYKRSS